MFISEGNCYKYTFIKLHPSTYSSKKHGNIYRYVVISVS